MQGTVYIDNLRPSEKSDGVIFDIILITGASILIALFSQLSFRLSFSPVPITGQTFAVLLTGMVLGKRRGLYAVLVYLGEGISGIPVFANASFGIVHLLGPTGGYLLGFLPAVYVTGYLAEKKWDASLLLTTLALIIGTVIVFVFGLAWLQYFVGTENLLAIGFFPFLPGAFLKILLMLPVLPLLNKWFTRSKN